jgi:sec-independent protein translocase protein TatA
MGIGIKELVVILVIVLLLFGTKRVKSLGSDLGAAIKGFRKSVQDDEIKDALAMQNSSSELENKRDNSRDMTADITRSA